MDPCCYGKMGGVRRLSQKLRVQLACSMYARASSQETLSQTKPIFKVVPGPLQVHCGTPALAHTQVTRPYTCIVHTRNKNLKGMELGPLQKRSQLFRSTDHRKGCQLLVSLSWPSQLLETRQISVQLL